MGAFTLARLEECETDYAGPLFKLSDCLILVQKSRNAFKFQ